MITFRNRYSDIDEPDKFGRWARTAEYRGIRIAWISRIEINENYILYDAKLDFPTLNNDTARDHKLFNSLEGAKEYVSERWEWFRKTIK